MTYVSPQDRRNARALRQLTLFTAIGCTVAGLAVALALSTPGVGTYSIQDFFTVAAIVGGSFFALFAFLWTLAGLST